MLTLCKFLNKKSTFSLNAYLKLFIYKNIYIMACACKNGSSNKQVTSVKQVVKKTSTPQTYSSTPKKNINARRIIFRKPI